MYRLLKKVIKNTAALAYSRGIGQWLTIIPQNLNVQHPVKRLVYLILPFKKYKQSIFTESAGAVLQKATIPLGVEGGTRSSAAERMMI